MARAMLQRQTKRGGEGEPQVDVMSAACDGGFHPPYDALPRYERGLRRGKRGAVGGAIPRGIASSLYPLKAVVRSNETSCPTKQELLG